MSLFWVVVWFVIIAELAIFAGVLFAMAIRDLL